MCFSTSSNVRSLQTEKEAVIHEPTPPATQCQSNMPEKGQAAGSLR